MPNKQNKQRANQGNSPAFAPTVQSERVRFEMYAAFMEGYVKRINAATFNVTIGGVRVGSAKYTRLAQINLQTRVITFSRFAVENVPERGRRYLVLHELAHVKEPSHNRRFWDFVSVWEPEHGRVNAELQTAFRKNIRSEQARLNAASRRIAQSGSSNWSAPDLMLKSYLEIPRSAAKVDYEGRTAIGDTWHAPAHNTELLYNSATSPSHYPENAVDTTDDQGDWMTGEFDEFEEDMYSLSGGSDDSDD